NRGAGVDVAARRAAVTVGRVAVVTRLVERRERLDHPAAASGRLGRQLALYREHAAAAHLGTAPSRSALAAPPHLRLAERGGQAGAGLVEARLVHREAWLGDRLRVAVELGGGTLADRGELRGRALDGSAVGVHRAGDGRVRDAEVAGQVAGADRDEARNVLDAQINRVLEIFRAAGTRALRVRLRVGRPELQNDLREASVERGLARLRSVLRQAGELALLLLGRSLD